MRLERRAGVHARLRSRGWIWAMEGGGVCGGVVNEAAARWPPWATGKPVAGNSE